MLTTLSIVRWRRRPRCPGHLWKHSPSHGCHRGAAWFENLKRVFYLKIDSSALGRNVWLCTEAPDQEGKPPCQEPSGTHQPHPLLSAWKVLIFYLSWSRNAISIRLCTIHVLWQFVLVLVEYLDIHPCLYFSMFSHNLSKLHILSLHPRPKLASLFIVGSTNHFYHATSTFTTIGATNRKEIQKLNFLTVLSCFQGHNVPRDVRDELCGVLEVTHRVILIHTICLYTCSKSCYHIF